jgi:hypothetical protein
MATTNPGSCCCYYCSNPFDAAATAVQAPFLCYPCCNADTRIAAGSCAAKAVYEKLNHDASHGQSWDEYFIPGMTAIIACWLGCAMLQGRGMPWDKQHACYAVKREQDAINTPNNSRASQWLLTGCST